MKLNIGGGVKFKGKTVAKNVVSPVYTLIEPEVATRGPTVQPGAWSNINNLIKGVNDDVNYAQLSGLDRNEASEYVSVTQYAMAILETETIDTLTVTYEMVGQNMGGSSRVELWLENNGSTITAQKNGSISTGIRTVSGNSAFWGVTLTPALLNDVDFGVRFRFRNITSDNDNRYGRVAYIKLTVTYA